MKKTSCQNIRMNRERTEKENTGGAGGACLLDRPGKPLLTGKNKENFQQPSPALWKTFRESPRKTGQDPGKSPGCSGKRAGQNREKFGKPREKPSDARQRVPGGNGGTKLHPEE